MFLVISQEEETTAPQQNIGVPSAILWDAQTRRRLLEFWIYPVGSNW